LNLFHLPADTFQLFVATGVINSRFGTLVAAMHTIAVAILGSLALAGGLQWNVRRILRFAVLTAVLLVGTLGGLRLLFTTVLRQDFAGADLLYRMQSLSGAPPAHVSRTARAPQLRLMPLRAMEELFRRDDGLVAYVLPAERGSVMTLLHPAYSVVVPQPDTIRLPLAYPVARGDERWLIFVNTWLELKLRDGTIDALYRHWILGQDAVASTRRWSIARNVLGWVK
jgi:hypothetical protein